MKENRKTMVSKIFAFVIYKEILKKRINYYKTIKQL